MHYFNVEGYPRAAANFAREANIQGGDDEDFMQARWEIRDHIYNGRFEAAIEALNEINPAVSFQTSLAFACRLPFLFALLPCLHD